MAKAKKRSGKKKVKASRGKPARRVMKKKAAVKRRTRTTAPRATPSTSTHTPVAVPGAWPFPMLSKP